MYIVFSVVWHVVVDNHQNVVDVDTSRHNVCCHKDIGQASLEAVHNVITLRLCQVTVHGCTVDVHVLQFTGDVLDFVFLARENNNTFQFTGFEQ